jgi:hypothetical protein
MGGVTSIVPALNKGLQRQHLPHRELISAQCSITGERFAPNERGIGDHEHKRSWARTLALKSARRYWSGMLKDLRSHHPLA